MAGGVMALLALCVASAAYAHNCTGFFSIVAPETALPGTTTAVLVSLHPASRRLNITVRLETQDGNAVKLLAAASRSISGYGIVPLKIPPSPAGTCTLRTTVGCPTDECSRQSHSTIRLLGAVRDVVVRPARHQYRPGDTITFWLLALQHSLRTVHDQLADVMLRDPHGTPVSVWQQLSLDEGVKKLSVALSPSALPGTWRVEASCGGVHTSVALNVSQATATRTTPAPAVAERHSVELRFADAMRRRYKPGLPFIGRVEAVSTEARVRVRVKLLDNSTDIYSQDIDVAGGEGAFVVPTVMADAPYLYLQAELVAVEGKEIETHYVLARESLKRWNSTAKCYLLIDNLPTPLQAGGAGDARVWSSCGCSRRLLAAVTSGGRAVHWTTVAPSTPANGTHLCWFNYTFPVTADMAPSSSVLVYYVTDDGHPVSDVATLHVKLLHKEVGVTIEERRWWYPHSSVGVRVRAPRGAVVCLIGARAGDDRRDLPAARSEEPAGLAPEFVSAGVSLFMSEEGSCNGGGVLYRQPRPAPAGRHDQLLGPDPGDRLWMWKCFNNTKEVSSQGVTISAPSETGRWSVWALSLSDRGIRFSEGVNLQVFRPLQLDFQLPSTLRVGETVELDVKITNNINSCVDVTALLALSAGAAFASTGMMYVSERLRLGPRGATQLVVRVAVNTPGLKNITVEVSGSSADNCSVGYGYNESALGSVVHSAALLVEPEGLLRSDTQSAYFCANEHLAVSTRSSWEWHWVPAPRNRAGLVLELRSRGPAHVALSSDEGPTPDMYRVVIDGPKVWIARGQHGYDVHLASATQSGANDECTGGWCAWWVWWEGGRLAVGRGARPRERPLLAWPLAPGAVVNFVGFSALWGDRADFRIWNFNEEAGFSQVLELALPHGVVPGSASGNLLVSGGLHLPVSVLHDQLADQFGDRSKDSHLDTVAARLAPLLALEHTPHLIDDEKREDILKNLPQQIQALLSFRNEDNSFSDHSEMRSHLSTVQTLEILSKAQLFYPIDPKLLRSIKNWIYSRQETDGSFSPLLADVALDISEYVKEQSGEEQTMSNNRNKKAWDRIVEITAETLATLLEVGVENEEDAFVVKKAENFLENSFHNVTASSALASGVYALVLSRSPVVKDALEVLRNASTTEEGEFGWPAPGHDAADWLLEESTRSIKPPTYGDAHIDQYRATVRVLLTACARGALADGEAAARYLYYRAPTLRKHPSLAYPATKAAAQFAQLAHDRHRALTVSLATAGMELTDTIELGAASPGRLLQLPGLPTKVFVYATGAGCATVQGTISYSTYAAQSDNAVLSIQSGIAQEIRPERSSLEELQGTLPALNIKTCFRWKRPTPAAVLRLEVSLFSGYELHSVLSVKAGARDIEHKHGSRGHLVWFVFAKVTSRCPVCVTYEVKSQYVISGLRPAHAKVYPTNRPDLTAETFFHARSDSSLLKGISDDDMITWFERAGNSMNETSAEECDDITHNAEKYNLEEFTETAVTEFTDILSKTPNVNTEEKASKASDTKPIKIDTKIPEPRVTKAPKKVTIAMKSVVVKGKKVIKISENQTVDNALTPTIIREHRDESAIQKAILPLIKSVLKKEIKDKPLIRRKGTLKATYGEHHETVMRKNLNESRAYLQNLKQRITSVEPYSKTEKPPTTTQSFDVTTMDDHFLIVKNNKLVLNILPQKLKRIALKISNESSSEEISTTEVACSTTSKPAKEPPTEALDTTSSLPKTTPKLDQSDFNPTSHDISKQVIFQKTSTTASPSAGRSKKEIVESTVLAPTAMITTETARFQIATTEKSNIPALKNDKFVNINEQSLVKLEQVKEQLDKIKEIEKPKSINKEIHKVPATPFSETSKTLVNFKDTIAPENRDGFEVLDKNELWELLKEEARPPGSHVVEKNLHTETSSKGVRSL